MKSTSSSNHLHGGSCGITPTATEYMTGTQEHVCTDQCAHIHLSAQLREFEHHVQQLSMTLSVKGFIWYHDAIAAIFATIWKGNTNE